MLPRLCLLVGSKGPTDRQTMSLIELSWTAKNVGAAPSCPQVRILLVPLRCHPAPQYGDLLFPDRIHFWDKMKLTTLLMKTNLSIWTKLVRLMKGPFNMSIYLAKVSSSKMNQVVLRSVSRSLTGVCSRGLTLQLSKKCTNKYSGIHGSPFFPKKF